MSFYMPTRIYDEPDCVRSHGKALAAFGHKALIVTGRSSAAKCGALDDVTAALTEQGVQYCLFSEVEENPSVETVVKGALYGQSEEADFVIGIGGGSPMDASKAIAFLLKRGTFSAEDLYDKSLSPDALDVIAVPTTCGTGSEVTGVSVLTVHEKQTKMSIPHKIFPRLALVDGKYLKDASGSILVHTALDAFAHMVESYESKKSTPYSEAAVMAGLPLWGSCRPVISGQKEPDEQELQCLMRASTFAGIAIAQTGTSIPHALSYILTYDQKIPHGLAAGYFLKGYLSQAQKEDREALLHAAGFTGMEDFAGFMDGICGNLAVPEKTLARACASVASNAERLHGCRMEMDEKILKEICGL